MSHPDYLEARSPRHLDPATDGALPAAEALRLSLVACAERCWVPALPYELHYAPGRWLFLAADDAGHWYLAVEVDAQSGQVQRADAAPQPQPSWLGRVLERWWPKWLREPRHAPEWAVPPEQAVAAAAAAEPSLHGSGLGDLEVSLSGRCWWLIDPPHVRGGAIVWLVDARTGVLKRRIVQPR